MDSHANLRALYLYMCRLSDAEHTITPIYVFLENENYTTIDLKPSLKLLLEKGFNIYGIYGKDDGLYSKEQVDELRKLLGEENLKYIDNCSHSVFIDQQTLFIEALKSWVK